MGADLLSIGSSGLYTAKKQLDTAGHNIANVHTEGYSRQRATATTAPPIVADNAITGTGSYIREVRRIHSDYLEDRLNANLTTHNYNEQRSELLGMVEEIFNEVNYEGLNHSLGRFFNSFRELSSNPNSETLRSVVRDQAKILVNHFHKTNGEIHKLTKNLDKKVEEAVATINNILNSTARLNVKIEEMELIGGEAGDLRDERDLNIRTLAEFFDIETYVDERNHFVVNAKGVGTLVSAQMVQPLITYAPPSESSAFPSSNEIFFGENVVSKQLQQGRISALFDTRDQELSDLKKRMDQIAFLLINSVNAIHRKGYINQSIAFDSNGLPVSQKGPVTDIDFFKPVKNAKDAIEYIDINDQIKNNLNAICSAIEPNAPGDNRIAIAISKLQHTALAEFGTRSLEDEFLQAVSGIGLSTNKARLDTEQSEGILAQTKALKERVSGVSLDEETANMVKFQHAYDASARVMRIADEMMKAILDIKR